MTVLHPGPAACILALVLALPLLPGTARGGASGRPSRTYSTAWFCRPSRRLKK